MNAPVSTPTSALTNYPWVSLNEAIQMIKLMGPDTRFLLRSQPGIGKTSAMKALAAELGMDLCFVEGGSSSVGDVAFPRIRELSTGEAYSEFAPNARFGVHKNKPVFVLLDELAKADQTTMPMFANLIQENRVGDYKLPEGSIVVATSNFDQDGLGDVVPAHIDNRMVTLFLSNPSANDFDELAEKLDLTHEVRGFVRAFPSVLDLYLKDDVQNTNLFIFNPRVGRTRGFVSPRSLVAADRILRRSMDMLNTNTANGLNFTALRAAFVGALGMAGGTELLSYVEAGQYLPTLEEIVESPQASVASIQRALLAIPTLISRLPASITTVTELDAVVEFLNQLGMSEVNQLFADLAVRRSSLSSLRMKSASFRKMISDLARTSSQTPSTF